MSKLIKGIMAAVVIATSFNAMAGNVMGLNKSFSEMKLMQTIMEINDDTNATNRQKSLNSFASFEEAKKTARLISKRAIKNNVSCLSIKSKLFDGMVAAAAADEEEIDVTDIKVFIGAMLDYATADCAARK